MARQLIILVGDNATLACQWEHFSALKSAVWIGDVSPHFATQSYFPFSKTKNLLGSEFPAIIYDARQGINLDALAMAAGTLQDGGQLLLLLNHWADLANQPDSDSLRWSGEKHAINTPHFIAFFAGKNRKIRFSYLSKYAVNACLAEASKRPFNPLSANLRTSQFITTNGGS